LKVFAISDLHLSAKVDKPMNIFGGNWDNHLEKIKEDWQNKVSDDDIILMSGDFSWAMTLDDAMFDFNSISELKGKKVMIRGNHDYWWSSISRIREITDNNFYIIQNDSIKIGDYVICGSRGWLTPGSTDFDSQDEKIYLREIERLRLSLKSAQKLKVDGDKLICMIHYPPFNARREASGFTELFESFNVDKVIYGHLHGKESRTDLFFTKNGIGYFLTSCDKLDFKLASIY